MRTHTWRGHERRPVCRVGLTGNTGMKDRLAEASRYPSLSHAATVLGIPTPPSSFNVTRAQACSCAGRPAVFFSSFRRGVLCALGLACFPDKGLGGICLQGSGGRVVGEGDPAIAQVPDHILGTGLGPDPANEARLKGWTETARASDLPNVHAFTRRLDLDAPAVIAALTLPFHNGRTEGVNTKTKMIKRQMYGPIHSPAPPDPVGLTPRTVTTESATESLAADSGARPTAGAAPSPAWSSAR